MALVVVVVPWWRKAGGEITGAQSVPAQKVWLNCPGAGSHRFILFKKCLFKNKCHGKSSSTFFSWYTTSI